MNIDRLRKLAQTGFETGISRYGGKKINQLNLNDIQAEISRSIILFKNLELPRVNALTYPFGFKPDRFWTRNKMYKMLKQQKVMLAFNNRDSLANLPGANPPDIDRIEITGRHSEKSFIPKLNLGNRGWF